MNFENSSECTKSELDLFAVPPTQTSIEEGVWDTIQPHSNFRTGTIQFDIPATSSSYIHMSETELHISAIVSKYDTTAPLTPKVLTATDVVGLTNNWIHSIFSQVEVFLNNTPVENSNSTYAYRAYLENLLNYTPEEKKHFLQMELFYPDDPKNFDHFNLANIDAVEEIKTNGVITTKAVKEQKVNNGYLTRRARLFDNDFKLIQMKGRIHSDIFNINRYLPNNLGITLKFTRSKESFCLCSDVNTNIYNITIENALLKVRRVKLSPSVMLAHALALEKSNMKIPIKRVCVRPITLPTSSNKTTLSGIHTGIIPKRVVIGFVDTDAFNGNYTKNPFNFKNFGLNYINLKVASKALPYSSGLSFSFKNNTYVEAYNTLFQGLREIPNGIDYKAYKHGNTLFAFDLSPDLCMGEHFSLLQDGSLDLDLSFEETNTSSITAIIYLEFDNIIEITKNRQILFDYKI
jgi:hypothetical protein